MAVEDAPRTDFYVTSVNWLTEDVESGSELSVKIRHGQRVTPCTLLKELTIATLLRCLSQMVALLPDNMEFFMKMTDVLAAVLLPTRADTLGGYL